MQWNRKLKFFKKRAKGKVKGTGKRMSEMGNRAKNAVRNNLKKYIYLFFSFYTLKPASAAYRHFVLWLMKMHKQVKSV